ncbi:hypothetical protein [uncultured Agrobacterium sp.]|uniref:hypothetical protein n=1 Tax=uncultured Agrobacterium sp. TaxID=157277 RepID=UPI002587FED6|nr:hypothetical protein [uncultured Agrobacterium sp.]
MVTKKTTTGKASTAKTVAKAPVTGDAAYAANIAAASEFAPSGAPVQSVPDVDPSHIAVDADPRKGTSETQNRIDFNDPTMSGQAAVEQNLKASE